MRHFFCVLLMLLLPLHGIAMEGGWYSSASAFDIAHEIDHLAGAAHHHDDDHGAVHYDGSSDSADHFAEHAAAQAYVALPAMELAAPRIEAACAAIVEAPQFLPDPFPQRLHRPPCSFG